MDKKLAKKRVLGLKIEFGTDIEYKIVKYTSEKLDWFNSQGYKLKFPKSITSESSNEEIKNQIIKEFDEKKYKKVASQIDSYFSTIKEELSKKLKDIFNNIPEIFVVHLTNYGVGGSYNLPNMIVFYLNNKNVFKMIIHEMIHLLIENNIQKYKINHWEKERIVDLILNSERFNFLGYNYWQNSYDGVERYVDKLFNSHFFKNPDDFFSKINGARI